MLRAWVLAPLALACAPTVELGVPSGAGTVLVARVDDPTTLEGLRGVVLRGASANAGGLPDEAWNLALAYERTPEELGWRLGPIAHDPAGSSRLRRPDAAYARADDGPWLASAPPAALASIRVAWPEDRCGAGPMCFEEGGLCAPCAAREPVAPPEPPRPWPTVECPSGMERDALTLDGEELASCTISSTACGAGARRSIEGRCVAVGAPCAGRWPASPPPGAIFAAADGSPTGAGTAEDPVDLDTAFARASAGDTIALSTGRHRVARVAPATLQGACVAGTVVALPVGARLEGAGLAARDLRLEGAAFDLRGARLALAGVVVAVQLNSGSSTITADDAVLTRHLYVVDGSVLVGRELELAESVLVRSRAELSRFVGTTLTSSLGAELVLEVGLLEPLGEKSGVNLYGGALRATRVVFRGGAFGLDAKGGTSTLEGVRFERQSNRALLVEKAHALTLREGVVLAARAALGALIADVEIEQLLAKDSVSTSIDFSAVDESVGDNDARLRDLRLFGSEDDLLGFKRGRFTLQRVHCDGAMGSALEAHGDRGPVRLEIEDMRLGNIGDAAIPIDGAEEAAVELTMSRVSLDEARGYGLGVWHGSARVRATDLRIERATAWRHWTCPPDRGVALCGGSGVIAYHRREVGQLEDPPIPPISLVLERFDISSEVAGLALSRGVELDARGGRVRAELGVLHRAGFEWRDRLIDVELDARQLAREDVP